MIKEIRCCNKFHGQKIFLTEASLPHILFGYFLAIEPELKILRQTLRILEFLISRPER